MDKIGDLAIKRASIILKGFDPISAGGFTQVPNTLLKNSKLSSGAKLCYAMLLSYAWQKDSCFPGQEKLAKDMGITSRMIRNYLKELEKIGYVESKRRGLTKTNVYILYARVKSDRK